MKTAMWKVAPLGDFRFSDRLAGQEVLFGGALDTTPLQNDLGERFQGQTCAIGDLEEYVVASTPFLKTHLKTQTLRPSIVP